MKNQGRSSVEDRIAALERKIAQQRQKLEQRKPKSPVIRDIPNLIKRLQKFAQLAQDSGRMDLANSTTLFVAGLNRIHAEASSPADLAEEEVEEEFERPAAESNGQRRPRR
jgi:hypothetical protein